MNANVKEDTNEYEINNGKIKKCEVIVNIEVDDINTIKSKFYEKDTVFLTDNLALLEQGRKLGLNITMLANYFGFFNKEDDEINEITIDRLNTLENYLNDGTLERTSIVVGFRYNNLINLMNLEKIKKILELNDNVVFLFKGFIFYFPAILDILKKMNIKSNGKILTVLNSEIVTLEFNYRYEQLDMLKEKMAKNRYEEYSFSQQYAKNKFKKQNIDVGFFLINNDTDFYLKPIYPILRELKKRETRIEIFTFDERTSNQIFNQRFNAINLSKYFLKANFSYSLPIIAQLKYVFNKLKYEKTGLIKNFYYLHLQKYSIIQNIISKLKNKSILKKFKIIPKSLVIIISVFYLIKIYLKYKYILMKWTLLKYYIRYLEKYKFIKIIINKSRIKPVLLKDLTGFDDPLNFTINNIPNVEVKKVIRFINRSRKIQSDDEILKNYLKYFNDVYVVNWTIQFLLTHSLIKTLIDKIQFNSFMIAADASPFNNIVCNIATSKKIPTFSIPQVYIKFQKITTILPSATTIFVSGEGVKNEFVRLGMNKQRITITGNPRYDYIKNIDKIENNYNQLTKKIVVVAMSRWHENDPEWMSELIEFCNTKSLDIIIKIHPMYKFSDNYEYSERLSNQIKKRCSERKFLISYDVDLSDIIPKSCLLITEYSIVAIDAAFNEIPVIVIDFFKNKDNEYTRAYRDEGIALLASNKIELFDAIEKILHDDNTKMKIDNAIKKFNIKYNYLNDGNAATRICELLTKTTKN
ncbi:MAG: CDP-glycerol glycerophosphotransferase family protein [Nitrosarchaeum sp.]|nr:CDP-glycerol glycerophosphotransferase family protein [Nitrosarchaeum sp.]